MPEIALLLVLVVVLLSGIIVFTIGRSLNKVKAEEALVIGVPKQPLRIRFSHTVVLPFVHTVSRVSLKAHTLDIRLEKETALRLRDGKLVDISGVFLVRINRTKEDVKRVVETLGVDDANDAAFVKGFFERLFIGAIRIVGSHYDWEDLRSNLGSFRDEVLNHIGHDLNGFVLDDCAFDHIQLTSIRYLKGERFIVVPKENLLGMEAKIVYVEDRYSGLVELEVLGINHRLLADFTTSSTIPYSRGVRVVLEKYYENKDQFKVRPIS